MLSLGAAHMSATGYFFFGSDTERSTLTIESKNLFGPKSSSFFFVDRLIGQKLSCLKKRRPCRGLDPHVRMAQRAGHRPSAGRCTLTGVRARSARRKDGRRVFPSSCLICSLPCFSPAEKHCPAPEQCTPTGGALCGRLASSRGGLAYTTDRRQPFSRVLSCVSHALGVRSSPTECIFPALRLTTVSPECRPAVALVSATAVSVTSSVAQRQFAVAQPLHSLTDGKGCHSFRKGACRRY